MFKFVLPVSGKEVEWKPLSYGVELNLVAQHKRNDMMAYLEPALVAARVVKFGAEDKCSMEKLYELDSIDVEALVDDIQQREAERKAALSKKREGSNAIQLQASIDQLSALAGQMGQCLKSALAQVRQAESSGAGPLK